MLGNLFGEVAAIGDRQCGAFALRQAMKIGVTERGRAPRSGGNESVVVILSGGRGGQATSSLCAPSTSFGLSSCLVS